MTTNTTSVNAGLERASLAAAVAASALLFAGVYASSVSTSAMATLFALGVVGFAAAFRLGGKARQNSASQGLTAVSAQQAA